MKDMEANSLLWARGAPRPVEIVRGLREIAAFLHVSHAEVLDMEKRGAPIVRRKNILRAEKGELWEWLKANSLND